MSSPDVSTDFTHPALEALDHLLRCLICREYYTAPLSLNACTHTFCSECLLSSLGVAKSCPSCRVEAHEGSFKKNNALEVVVRSWKDARAALLALQAVIAPPPAPAPRAKQPRNRKASTSTAIDHDSNSEYDDEAEDTKPRRSGRHSASAGSSKGKGKQRETEEDLAAESSDIEIIEAPSRKSKRPGKEVPDSAVLCPVCEQSFSMNAVNSHMDLCLRGETPKDSKREWGKLMGGSAASSSVGKKGKVVSATKSSTVQSEEKRIPLTQYDNLSLKQAKALCTNVGITSAKMKPDSKAYTKLHGQWVILWNSNCALLSNDPERKSKAQLLTELKKWETLQDVEKAGIDRRAHAKKYEPDFKELIRVGRERQAAAKALVSDSLPLPPSIVSSSTAPTSDLVESPTPKPVLEVVAPSIPVELDDYTLGDLDDFASPTPSPTFIVPSIPRLSGTATAPNAISKRQRESSPFDPEGPKPSQRVREIEWDDEDDEGGTEGDSSREVGGGDVSMD